MAKAYVDEHPDTLLVVTADHECGGLTVEDLDPATNPDESGPGGTYQSTAGETTSGEDGPFSTAGSDEQFVLDWTTGGHTGVPVPVLAEGPLSERLAGTYRNTAIHDVLAEALLG